MTRERERKFDLDPGRPLPRLDVVAPISTQCEPERLLLDAAYFDTDDHRLLTAKVTLRRRTGGPDEGWHLKLPADSGGRDEVRLPLTTGDGVPGALVDRVRAILDDRELVEIARIRTERHSHDLLDQSGRRLAVLSDDQVSATLAGEVVHLDGWRELEIELEPAGKPELLDVLADTLIGAGVRPAHWSSKLRRLLADVGSGPSDMDSGATAGEVVLAYLRKQVEAVRRHDLGVRRDEEDAVRRLRVALRRLRSALTGFRRVLDREHTKEIAAELKWAGATLSDARDAEVLRELLTAELATLARDQDVDEARTRLVRHFDQVAGQTRAAILDQLNSPRYARLLASLERLVARPPLTARASRPARAELGRAIARANRRLTKAVGRLPDASHGDELDSGLHDVRKKAKQARYLADAVRPALDGRLRHWRRAARSIQRTLGEQHDLVQARALLHGLTRTDGAPEQAAFHYGLLFERSLTRGTELRADFARQWRKFPEPT